MAENKTQQTDASVEGYLAAIPGAERRSDCQTLAKLMTSASKQPAKMWGSSIVGFGSHHYRYDSGREGDSCVVGFSSRKGDISIYGLGSSKLREELFPQLGAHKAGKGCLYIRRLRDVQLDVLERLIASAFADKP